MRYTLRRPHDDKLCEHIGAVLGQTADGWSLVHERGENGIVLVFPDTVTKAQVDAAVDSYDPGDTTPAPVEKSFREELDELKGRVSALERR